MRTRDVVPTITSDGKQYAQIVVDGKTGSPPLLLTDSLPHVKEWISRHPHKENREAILFCSKQTDKILDVRSIFKTYKNYKKYFAKLANDPDTSEEDRIKIRRLFEKRWNPYVRRHSAHKTIIETP